MFLELMIAGTAMTGFIQDTDTTFSAGDATRLDVESMGGEVVVEAWDRNEIRIEADHSRRSEVEIRNSGRTIYVEAEGEFFSGIVDYRIQVPADFDIAVEGWQTSISIAGVNGRVDAETFQGSVDILGGRGSVTASAVSGNITVDGAEGEVAIEGVSGTIRVMNSGGSIEAEAVGGSIIMENIDATSVEAATVGGRVQYEGSIQPSGSYYFGTHGGRIVLELPATTNADLDVSTLSGSVRVDHAASVGDIRRGRRSRLTLGDGGPEIEIETFSGSVVIRETGSNEEDQP